MNEFRLYFGLGREHILDYVSGYDHILFVLALCAVYRSSDWKRVLVLVTAFTIGHSITLALATFRVLNFRTDIIEFLIPVTIFITACSNLLKKTSQFQAESVYRNYYYALFFGLIHGMGFSNYLKAILGSNQSIVKQLLAFNLGLEFGQLVIVVIFMTATFIFVDLLRKEHRDFRMIVSSAIAGMSLILMKESVFW